MAWANPQPDTEMKNVNSANALGFPSKPTRRGGRAKQSGSNSGVPMDHMKNLTNAMDLGDHGRAKQHAFALIRSLPKAQMGQDRPNDAYGSRGNPEDATATGTDDFSGPNVNLNATPKNTAATPGKGGGQQQNRLAAMLKMKKPVVTGAT